MAIRLYRKRTPPLGDLERDVMERLWTSGSVSAQGLHDQLADQRAIALSTVQSTVERLVRKGLLAREKRGRAYVYAPAISRRSLLSRMVAELVSDLADGDEPAGAGLVDLSEDIDDAALGQLEDWLHATRRARGSGTTTR